MPGTQYEQTTSASTSECSQAMFLRRQTLHLYHLTPSRRITGIRRWHAYAPAVRSMLYCGSPASKRAWRRCLIQHKPHAAKNGTILSNMRQSMRRPRLAFLTRALPRNVAGYRGRGHVCLPTSDLAGRIQHLVKLDHLKAAHTHRCVGNR